MSLARLTYSHSTKSEMLTGIVMPSPQIKKMSPRPLELIVIPFGTLSMNHALQCNPVCGV